MSDGAMCFYCRRYNCICEAESSPPKTEVRRQARIDCQNKTCGEYNCDSCYPPQRVAAQSRSESICRWCGCGIVAVGKDWAHNDCKPRLTHHAEPISTPSPAATTQGDESSQLLPCPFCGGKDLRIIPVISEDEPKMEYARTVLCRDCHCHGRHHYRIGWTESDQAAKEGWNDRWEPNPAPQAEGWRNHLVKRMFDECGAEKANDFIRRVESGEHDVPSPWSAAQAPLLQKIAELESLVHTRTVEVGKADTERLEEISKRKQVAKNLSSVESKWKKAEARIAELESAQPKAEPVEKLVSYNWIKAMVGNMDEDEPTSQALRELQQYRQREERRER